MALTDRDRELWRAAMKDVKPLDKNSVVTSQPRASVVTKPEIRQHHTWDLHGMTLKEAHQHTLSQIEQQHQDWRFVTFVTGKSGQMRHEFESWLSTNPHVKSVESTNDGGAYRVWFKLSRQKIK